MHTECSYLFIKRSCLHIIPFTCAWLMVGIRSALSKEGIFPPPPVSWWANSPRHGPPFTSDSLPLIENIGIRIMHAGYEDACRSGGSDLRVSWRFGEIILYEMFGGFSASPLESSHRENWMIRVYPSCLSIMGAHKGVDVQFSVVKVWSKRGF